MKTKETNEWNANTYNKHANFVSVLGMPVVDLLNPQKNEKILDLGCGDGTLAVEIEKSEACVIAVDLSEGMVEKSKQKGIETYVMSVTQLEFENEFDAVFSNAVLHWVKESEEVVKNIHKVLKVGGRFVAEFGGHDNVHHIVEAMKEVFSKHQEYGIFDNPWFFPTAEVYANTLESQGFEVEYIELISRPTPIDDIAHWLGIFTNGITEHLSENQKSRFGHEVREILKEKIYSEEEGWVADYVRLRVKAIKRT
jgi:2-isopropylmalate synthase